MRLALGTVQFGMPYGISNKTGQVEFAEVEKILGMAQEAGVRTLDTAIGYGASEDVLGRAARGDWDIYTKLPGLPDTVTDPGAWVLTGVQDSLRRLKREGLKGLLLHRPGDLLSAHGEGIRDALLALRERGIVERIGYSIYDPASLAELIDRLRPDIIQAPYNLIDRRLRLSGWLDRLPNMGTAIHTRSVFLQGLLLMSPEERPPKFRRWAALWDAWDAWRAEHSTGGLGACLEFARREPGIERFVVGVDSAQNLQEILQALREAPRVAAIPETLACDDLDLIDPSRWWALS